MFSAEKERVNFVKILDPNNKNVEDWMTELEDQMKMSVRAALNKSVIDYYKTQRTKWVPIINLTSRPLNTQDNVF